MTLGVVLYPVCAGFVLMLAVACRAAAVDAGYEVQAVRPWHWAVVGLFWPLTVVYLLARVIRAAVRMCR